MNNMHYSLNEISPIWMILIAILLFVQGTWIFQDARKRGRFPGCGDYGESPDSRHHLLYIGS